MHYSMSTVTLARCCLQLMATLILVEQILGAPHGNVEHQKSKIHGTANGIINGQHNHRAMFNPINEEQPATVPNSELGEGSQSGSRRGAAYDTEKVARAVARKVYGKALMDRMPKKPKFSAPNPIHLEKGQSGPASPKSPKSLPAYDTEKVARAVARKVYGKALMDKMPKRAKKTNEKEVHAIYRPAEMNKITVH